MQVPLTWGVVVTKCGCQGRVFYTQAVAHPPGTLRPPGAPGTLGCSLLSARSIMQQALLMHVTCRGERCPCPSEVTAIFEHRGSTPFHPSPGRGTAPQGVSPPFFQLLSSLLLPQHTPSAHLIKMLSLTKVFLPKLNESKQPGNFLAKSVRAAVLS